MINKFFQIPSTIRVLLDYAKLCVTKMIFLFENKYNVLLNTKHKKSYSLSQYYIYFNLLFSIKDMVLKLIYCKNFQSLAKCFVRTYL